MMKSRNMFLIPVLLLLAAALFGCSADNAVLPNADGGTPGSADKEAGALVHIQGNVYDYNQVPAVGAPVAIFKSQDDEDLYLITVVNTVTDGFFSWDENLAAGEQIRCASLGDSETLTWSGGAYMYFRLDRRPGIKRDVNPVVYP